MFGALKSFWSRMRHGVGNRDTQQSRPLQREADNSHVDKQALKTELAATRQKIETLSAQHADQLGALHEQLAAMEAEREGTRQRLEDLRTALESATEHQTDADNRILQLGLRLEKEQRKRQEETEAAQARARTQSGRLQLATLVAVCALLLGALSSGLMFRNSGRTTELLAQLGSDIADIKETVRLQADAMQSRMHAPPPADYRPQYSPPPTDSAPAVQHNPQQERPAHAPWPQVFTGAGQGLHDNYRTRRQMQAFFEQNAAQDGVITLTDGLQYRVLSQGIGKMPATDDLIVLDYSAHLLDGTELFDSHREPVPVRFDAGQLAPGLREVVARMEEGAQWEVYVSPDLAYRQSTRNRKKFGYEPLVYVVDLIAVLDGSAESHE